MISNAWLAGFDSHSRHTRVALVSMAALPENAKCILSPKNRGFHAPVICAVELCCEDAPTETCTGGAATLRQAPLFDAFGSFVDGFVAFRMLTGLFCGRQAACGARFVVNPEVGVENRGQGRSDRHPAVQMEQFKECTIKQ
jgi:hypothetical protein